MTGVALMISLLTPALGAPPAEALARRVAVTASDRSEHGRHVMPLTGTDLEQIAAGRVVRRRLRVEGTDVAVGAMWSDQPIDALWLAILDDKHFKLVDGLFEEQLPGTAAGRKVLFQHIDLPWPFRDRQWVLEIDNNGALFEHTDGAVWERTWTLSDPAQARSAREDALWVSLNDGGWQIYSWPDGALLVYQVRASMDGWITDDLVTRYAMSTLERMLRDIDGRAAGMAEHYDHAHTRLLRPDGSKILSLPPPGASRQAGPRGR